MESKHCDVVIVGGGLSGLSAAYYLLKKDKGLSITVLEAKDRVGGRILTAQLKSADGNQDFWDAGGEWIGRPQPHLRYLLRKFSLDTFCASAPHGDAQQVSPQISSIPLLTQLDLMQFSWKLNRLKKRCAVENLHNCVEAVTYDGMTFEEYKEKNLWTEGAKEIVNVACRCMFGLLPSEMTTLYFLMYIKSAGGLATFTKPSEFSGKESRVKGGFSQLINHLLHKVGKKNILLSQPVTHIIQGYERVTVVTTNRLQIHCMRVVLAIAPHLMVDIKFTPDLPSHKMSLLKTIPLAFIVKFIFSYEEAFWSSTSSHHGQFGFQTVLQDPEHGPVGVAYDATSARGNPAIVGFMSASRGPSANDDKHRHDIILDLLEAELGPEVRNYIDYTKKDWSKEPYNGGCFLKSLIPGTTKYFNQTIRESFDRVHFAGTETATVWCGLMNGAVQAGFRSATEVLYHLRPQLITSPDPERQHLFEENNTDSKRSVISVRSLVYLTLGLGLATLVYKAIHTETFSQLREQTLFKLVTE